MTSDVDVRRNWNEQRRRQMLVIKWLMLIAFMLFMSVIAFAHDEK
ncbi:hypothetical protein [Lactobacillus phage phiEF-1.1]|nr:hypothetical protein [Lactobacillus phage phiEF-1.1]